MQVKGAIDKNSQIHVLSEHKTFWDVWCEKNKDKVCYITIDRERKKRTNKENDYYWCCIVRPLAEFFGYFDEEMHEALGYMFLRCEEPGKPPKRKRTSDHEFTTGDAEDYYNKIRMWALTEYNFKIALPGE